MGFSVTRALSVRRISLALLVGSGLAAVVSAGATPAPPPTAASIASLADRHYNSLHSLRVNFVQQYDGMGMHRRESGTLLLSKPNRMRWTYAQPPGKLFVLDGRDAWFYSPGETEIQRVPAKKLDDLRSPLQFLLGHTRIEKELTNLTLTSPTPVDGTLYTLTGTPKGMEQRIVSFRLTVTPAGIIQGIRIEETDGAITTFTFTNEEPNLPTTKSDFTFTPPPGTTVVTSLPPI